MSLFAILEFLSPSFPRMFFTAADNDGFGGGIFGQLEVKENTDLGFVVLEIFDFREKKKSLPGMF